MMESILLLAPELGIPKREVFRYFQISRQGAMKQIRAEVTEREMMERVVIEVNKYRQNKDRMAGSRSLYYNLDIKRRYNIGVTKFEQLMSKYEQTLAPLRIRVVTTKSCFQSWNYENLLLDPNLVLNAINQVVVGDLTYINIGKERYYVFNLMDLYSGFWVGIFIGKRMRADEALAALNSFIELRGGKNLKGCVHHTDGGAQYFSSIYMKMLASWGLISSVAGNALENGFAEQRNSFLKHHLLPTIKSGNADFLQAELMKKMQFYNYERKQKTLGWRTPAEFEKQMMALPVEERLQKNLYKFKNAKANNKHL